MIPVFYETAILGISQFGLLDDTMNIPAPVTRLVLYVRDIEKIAGFYIAHFGFIQNSRQHDDLIEIISPSGGCALMLHQASKGHRTGQSCIKIIFDVDDIEGFKQEAAKKGLEYGKTYKGPGYEFANARDPAKNPIQISRRAFINETVPDTTSAPHSLAP